MNRCGTRRDILSDRHVETSETAGIAASLFDSCLSSLRSPLARRYGKHPVTLKHEKVN